ncbi:MAG: histidine phosphatase family protein [Methylococcales bacterium]|nr:histidine phosphatase family protein [Methylococcales bacterium]
MRKVYKELLLLRHGKSDWNSDSTDFYRSLKKRGKHNAHQIGEWLAEKNLVPDLIISSPAIRALTTAEIVGEAMGLAQDSIETDQSIYEASISDLRQILFDIPTSVQRLLLVGHNPGFEYLVHNLAPNIPSADNGNLMPTAALAYFQLDSQWSRLVGDSWVQRPKDLPQ